MPGSHDHGGRDSTQRVLLVAFVLIGGFMVVEFVGGYLTGSLALVSDAGHMATDALGLGMALAAVTAAARARTDGARTYGLYRLEILAALANSVLLFAVAGYVLWEAVQRLSTPTEVASVPMLVVAMAGLAVNIIAWRLLRDGAKGSLNMAGAYSEVIADMAGSIGAILAGLIIISTGWTYADPLFAAAVAVFILPRAWSLGSEAVRILTQAAPANVDLGTIKSELLEIEGVVDVHDLHVWTLTSQMDVASVHLMTKTEADPHPILDRARDLLQTGHAIDHATLQVEPESHRGCSEINW